LSKTYDMSDAELDKRLHDKITAAQGGMGRMQTLAKVAREHGISIASHDDDTPEKVALIQGLGAVISEFPINLETAKAAKAKGLFTLFGAPNILRGKSQSGSMRALDAVLNGVADCLCGDYSPAALLPAALQLPQLAGISLAQSVALVTKNPAHAAGLTDRGQIAIGKRADLIAVSTVDGMAQVEKVWVAGSEVLNTRFNTNPLKPNLARPTQENALA
jgi:alpha-D-ribose 1-methylphosphonate 5-triphosphate diphosphatase